MIVIGELEKLRRALLTAEGSIEEACSLLIGLEDRGEKWAAQLHVEINSYRETLAIIEQKARKEWIPKIQKRVPEA